MDMFKLMDVLKQAIDGDSEDLCSLALHLLLLDVAITDELVAKGVAPEILDMGGIARVSLLQWRRYVGRQSEQTFARFLVGFIEAFMLSQHFGTATRRYETGKQRLRVTIEENGLTSMITSDALWYPQRAPDRIETMLSLVADCGMLENTESGYTVPN